MGCLGGVLSPLPIPQGGTQCALAPSLDGDPPENVGSDRDSLGRSSPEWLLLQDVGAPPVSPRPSSKHPCASRQTLGASEPLPEPASWGRCNQGPQIGDLKQQEPALSQPWRLKSEIQGQAGPDILWGLQGEAFPPPAAPAAPGTSASQFPVTALEGRTAWPPCQPRSSPAGHCEQDRVDPVSAPEQPYWAPWAGPRGPVSAPEQARSELQWALPSVGTRQV